jgi:microspherule protein 1
MQIREMAFVFEWRMSPKTIENNFKFEWSEQRINYHETDIKFEWSKGVP